MELLGGWVNGRDRLVVRGGRSWRYLRLQRRWPAAEAGVYAGKEDGNDCAIINNNDR